MPQTISAVGADVGGTWIRLQALDHHGKPVRFFRGPTTSLKKLPSYLKRILRRWKIVPLHLAIGSRGVWHQKERRGLQKRLKLQAKHVTVISDVEAAWFAAFKNEGILVISGTGSIAFARDSKGHTGRAGGLGPWIGDEGSAFWIGKTWLERNGSRKPSDVRRTAALARDVERGARRGNLLSRSIILEAQDHLAVLVTDLIKRLHWKKPIPVSWAGSVLDNAAFRKGFMAAIRRKTKRRIQFIQRSTDPATAVALHALRTGSHACP